jgi:hypothetical protein
MKPIVYTLTITLEDDMHTGAGLESGEIDAVVAKDRHGKPIIPATHLKGVMRDNACKLTGLTSDQVNALFGKKQAQSGAVILTSAYWQGKEYTPMIMGFSAREEGSRIAKEGSLRQIEYIPAGSEFTAQIYLKNDALKEDLIQVLQVTDRLGSRRSRGAGQLSLTLEAFQPLIKQITQPTPTKQLRLMLKNLSPLVLPQTGVPGNIISTQSFIRGQTLLGALTGYALSQGKKDMANKMLSGAISVGNAYPLPEKERETASIHDWEVLPIPLYLQSPKSTPENSEFPHWAKPEAHPYRALNVKEDLNALADRDDENRGEKTKRPHEDEYVAKFGDNQPWLRYQPQTTVRLRNHFTDEKLFAIEEIAEHTCFMVDIQFENEKDCHQFMMQFAEVLSGQAWLTIGRGGAPVQVTHYSTSVPQSAKPERDDLYLTFTSDWIVRGEHLGFLEGLDAKAWRGLVGVEPKLIKDMTDFEWVYGHNATSGLPRASAVAIRRGSTWRLKNTEFITKLLNKSVYGERTDEGYGRYRIGSAIGAEAPTLVSENTKPDNKPTQNQKTGVTYNGKPNYKKNKPQTASTINVISVNQSETIASNDTLNAHQNDYEDIMQAVDAWTKNLTGKMPSKTQWRELHGALIANIDNIQAVKAWLQEKSNTTAGKVWDSVQTKTDALFTQIATYRQQNPDHARFFADQALRLAASKAKENE